MAKQPSEYKPEEYARPIAEIINDLRIKIPPTMFKKLPGKKSKSGGTGAAIDYIPWYNAVKVLDKFAPGWSGHVVKAEETLKRAVVVYRITLPCAEGMVSREATGYEDIEGVEYGDPFSNAESMAFRRAAAKFGLALHMYERD